MIKSFLAAAALVALATPAASASDAYNTRVVTKIVTPVLAVSKQNRRVVRRSNNRINRRSVIVVKTPIITISPPVLKVIAAPTRSRRVVTRR